MSTYPLTAKPNYIEESLIKMVTLPECISKITNEVKKEGQNLESPQFTDEKDW
jgi:hypothetical protein